MKEDVADVKADTTAIRAETAQIPSIKKDTAQIELLVQEIGFLRLQLNASSAGDARAQHLQRFLDQSTTYAETVIDSLDLEERPVSSHSDRLQRATDNMAIDSPQSPVAGSGSANTSDYDEAPYEISLPPWLTEFLNIKDTRVTLPITAEETQVSRSESSGSPKRDEDQHLVRDQSQHSEPTAAFDQALSKLVDPPPRPRTVQTRSKMNTKPQYMVAVSNETSQPKENETLKRISSADTSVPMRRSLRGLDLPREPLQPRSSSPKPIQASPGPRNQNQRPVISSTAETQPRSSFLSGEYGYSLRQREIIEGSRARSYLSAKERTYFDKQLEIAVRGKKRVADKLRRSDVWMNEEVGSVPEIRNLLVSGADPNFSSSKGSIMEIERYNANRIEVLELLLKAGATMTTTTWGAGELLLRAAESGRNDLVQMLLRNGVPVNTLNASGHSSLSRALCELHPSTAKLLIENGAKCDAMALRYAIGHGYVDIVKDLLARGVSATAKDALGEFIVVPGMRDGAAHGHVDMFKILLEHGAPADGKTLCQAAESGQTELVEVLLDGGAPLGVKKPPRETQSKITSFWYKYGSSVAALAWASRNGHVDTVRLLLQRGAKADAAALCMAARDRNRDHPEIIHLLLENGAPLNGAFEGQTALHTAAAAGNWTVVKALLQHDATVHEDDLEAARKRNLRPGGAAYEIKSLLMTKYNEQ